MVSLNEAAAFVRLYTNLHIVSRLKPNFLHAVTRDQLLPSVTERALDTHPNVHVLVGSDQGKDPLG